MSRRRVHYTSLAYDDLATLLANVNDRHGMEAALAVDTAIERVVRSLESMPERGRMMPELRDRGYTEFRELITAPYRVVYKPVNGEVWLVAIVDGRRDLGELIFERARRNASA